MLALGLPLLDTALHSLSITCSTTSRQLLLALLHSTTSPAILC